MVPWGTAKPALKFETGLLPMKFRVMMRKLTFVNMLKHKSDESLAKMVLDEQPRGSPKKIADNTII